MFSDKAYPPRRHPIRCFCAVPGTRVWTLAPSREPERSAIKHGAATWRSNRPSTDLEEEHGLKLFSRAKRVAQPHSGGKVFYAEALRTLAQAELAVDAARRAANGEIGKLSIGFLGSATSACLSELMRKSKERTPDPHC